MRRFIRSRPSPAMAIAFVALFAALAGGAVALPGNNSVTSGDIKNGQVKSKDIKNNDVRSKDIRNNTVSGNDVNESSLGVVPNAANANHALTATNANNANLASNASTAVNAANSAKVGGLSVRKIRFQVEPVVGVTTILNLNGLILKASCPSSGGLTLTASGPGTAGSTAHLQSYTTSGTTTQNSVFDSSLLTTDNVNLLVTDNDLERGHTEFEGPGGATVSAVWATESFSQTGPDCIVTGHAIG